MTLSEVDDPVVPRDRWPPPTSGWPGGEEPEELSGIDSFGNFSYVFAVPPNPNLQQRVYVPLGD